jgi:hypothetical protein
VISQADVEAELRRRVTELGGQIAWGREVVAAVEDSHGVTVRLADGGQNRAGWLVGCDGASSCGRAGSRRQPAGPVRQRLLGAGEILLRPRGVRQGPVRGRARRLGSGLGHSRHHPCAPSRRKRSGVRKSGDSKLLNHVRASPSSRLGATTSAGSEHPRRTEVSPRQTAAFCPIAGERNAPASRGSGAPTAKYLLNGTF